MGHDEEWLILAEEAAQEKDPQKLMDIITALTRALNERNGDSAKKRGAA